MTRFVSTLPVGRRVDRHLVEVRARRASAARRRPSRRRRRPGASAACVATRRGPRRPAGQSAGDVSARSAPTRGTSAGRRATSTPYVALRPRRRTGRRARPGSAPRCASSSRAGSSYWPTATCPRRISLQPLAVDASTAAGPGSPAARDELRPATAGSPAGSKRQRRIDEPPVTASASTVEPAVGRPVQPPARQVRVGAAGPAGRPGDRSAAAPSSALAWVRSGAEPGRGRRRRSARGSRGRSVNVTTVPSAATVNAMLAPFGRRRRRSSRPSDRPCATLTS